MAKDDVLEVLPPCGLLDLRGPADAIGLAVPVAPCTYAVLGERTAYWLGPDEWLLRVPAGDEGEVERGLREALAGRGAVVDVSGGYRGYALDGPFAQDVLMKASPYDFDPRAFASGRCVQTVFAKTTALVASREDGSFELLVRRSYADYFERWVEDAMAEHR